jgi:hypothetical protein
MKSLNPRPRVKRKYLLFGFFFVMVCAAISAYPIWLIADWLAVELNILDGEPVKEQANGLLWLILFIMETIIILLVSYGVLGLLCSIVAGWSKQSYINIFWKRKLPIHWLEQ